MKFLADPLFWLWLVLMSTGIVLFLRKRRKLALLLLGAAIGSSAFEFFQIPAHLLASLERPYLFTEPGAGSLARSSPADTNASRFDAVIVLGGYMEPFEDAYTGMELGDPVDRLVTGIELIRQDQTSVLVLGGSGEGHPPRPVEAQTAARWINSWNIAPVQIEYLGVSADTHDEAVHAAALAQQRGWTNILLVTSAWHMKRAEAAFRRTGLHITPVGSDFQGTTAARRTRSFVPRTKTLLLFRTWTEETIGYFYYRLRSWA